METRIYCIHNLIDIDSLPITLQIDNFARISPVIVSLSYGGPLILEERYRVSLHFIKSGHHNKWITVVTPGIRCEQNCSQAWQKLLPLEKKVQIATIAHCNFSLSSSRSIMISFLPLVDFWRLAFRLFAVFVFWRRESWHAKLGIECLIVEKALLHLDEIDDLVEAKGWFQPALLRY